MIIKSHQGPKKKLTFLLQLERPDYWTLMHTKIHGFVRYFDPFLAFYHITFNLKKKVVSSFNLYFNLMFGILGFFYSKGI